MKIYRNGNSAKFFSFAGNGKYFEELSALILNRIVACVNCAGRLAHWVGQLVGTHAKNKAMRDEANRKQ